MTKPGIFAAVAIFFLSCASLAYSGSGRSFGIAEKPFLDCERAIDLYCLRLAYPMVVNLKKDPSGCEWLVMANGSLVPYWLPGAENGLATDVSRAMAQLYPLEPTRPDTPPGYAPGRKRSYELLGAIYGNDARAVRKNLCATPFLNKKIWLSAPAATAFANTVKELRDRAARNRDWLVPEGGFYWRAIAGENALSAHSYGIALDVGVKKAPYWRWNKVMPHPLQKTYPGDIVAAFEEHGFIWGGKWHEYDLMHFEYRPEIICKARLRRAQGY